MLDPSLIAILEKSLLDTRKEQHRLTSRLREVEMESDRLRDEIKALENSAAQTESAIDGLLVAMRTGSRSAAGTDQFPNSGEFVRAATELASKDHSQARRSDEPEPNKSDKNVAYFSQRRSVPSRGSNIEPVSHRFSDRTITQACTLLLREAGEPLHVNELYNLLVSGGMEFKGNNPTISVAVSLNRNRRFRKVGPGTFDLVMRDASRAAS